MKQPEEPFDISLKEIETSKKYLSNYYIFRVGFLNGKPVFYKIGGEVEKNFELSPTSYKAKLKEN